MAVTGMGVVSPIGCALEEFRENLFAGVSGVGPITLFDPASLPARIAAEVKLPRHALAGYRDRKVAFALLAAEAAMAETARTGTRPGGGNGRHAGVALGLGLELFSMDDFFASKEPHFELPADRFSRLSFLQTPSDICLHLIAHRFGLDAPPAAHVSACAAGTDAIGHAYRLIASGQRQWMLAGGTDSMVNPLGVGGFCKLNALSTRNDCPQAASRPFDRSRDGFVLGEGAAVLVLEDLEAARARGAHIHAEIAGYHSSFDAHGISEPHPEGLGAYLAMAGALRDAGLAPEDVDAVNAHGTSTPKNDPAESAALKMLFGARAKAVPISSTKSMIGHLIAAAGAVEAVAAILGMEAGIVHPTINLEEPDPECGLDYVPKVARRHAQRIVLSSSFAFGGQNAAIVLGRPD